MRRGICDITQTQIQIQITLQYQKYKKSEWAMTVTGGGEFPAMSDNGKLFRSSGSCPHPVSGNHINIYVFY